MVHRMSYRCDSCSKKFKKDEDLYSHKIQILMCSTCQYCGERFQGRDQIRQHMKANHLDFPCSMCKRNLFLLSGRETHERMKHRGDNLASALSSIRLSRGNTKFLSDLRSSGSLENLLVREVRPDPEKTRIRNRIVDSLALFMQHNTKYSVREVVKGGSSGKGTSIKKKADVDLVVYINDYASVTELQQNMTSVLKNLRDHLLKDANWAKQVHFTRYTSHSVRVGIRKNPGDDMTEVDILPAIDIGQGSRQHTWDKMARMPPHDRSFYSVSFAKDQVDFVRRVPDDVKNLIRITKHWKRRDDISIVSYCIELIVIKQWMKMGEPTHFDLRTGFKNVMRKISGLGSMRITWPSRYNSQSYGLPSAPAVMDPANPFINTADRISNVSEIERKAREIYETL